MNNVKQKQAVFRKRKGFKMKEEKGFLSNFKKIGGMDLWMYVVCAILIGATVATGSMSNDLMLTSPSVCLFPYCFTALEKCSQSGIHISVVAC